MPPNIDKAINLRRQCSHFRILVIGRANAGKTTLLKKVCNSIEDPVIFSPSGDVVISPLCFLRGLHDIENQLIFQSNPQFIFHDTRGFESGSVAETEKVKAFIAKRARSTELSYQLHAIWQVSSCSESGDDTTKWTTGTASPQIPTGHFPVIAIFTMFDGLITEAFTQLKESGVGRKEAKDRQNEQAQEMLTTKFVKPLMSTGYPPADHVRLDDMRLAANNCNELIKKTANALNDDTLKLLFVSVQQNNINICVNFAVEK
ncbi:GTP-binding protein [Mycena pura]|uniref:GTP-binding protein n=1 Tax=Mycena pura TaxID=153505 RepID=A0AAD6Y2E7_9AGAR|nr:GTP-binding protein [Mycena pura]